VLAPLVICKQSFHFNTKKLSGIVIRSHEGEVMATKCLTKPYITDPLTAEAVAAWTAATLIGQLELKDVILEGDSLSVVQVLRSEERSGALFGHLMDEAKLLLQSCHTWEVQHVQRSGNEVAHQLAKLALDQNIEHMWTDSFPSCISEIVMAEKQFSE
jgi:ribonuclease HI